MKTLQFLIDNICADFTIASLLGAVKSCLAAGPCQVTDITEHIKNQDRSLDVKCAEGLAAGAVQYLIDNGDIEIRGGRVHALSAAYRSK